MKILYLTLFSCVLQNCWLCYIFCWLYYCLHSTLNYKWQLLNLSTASQRGSCNNSSKNGDSSSDDSDDDSEKSKLKALVRKRKRQLKRILKTRDVPPLVFANYNCVPFITHGQKSADIDENYKESVPSDVNFQWIYHREPSNEFEVAQLEHSVLNVNLVHSNHVLVLDIFRRDQNNMPSFSELQDDGQVFKSFFWLIKCFL